MNKIESLRQHMSNQSVDLVVLGPGMHLRWLTGLSPHADERPLLLCVTESYIGFLMPSLEADSARQHTDLPFHTWADNDGPDEAFRELMHAANAQNAQSIVLDETMRADFAALVQDALPNASRQFCETTVGDLRLRKDADEFQQLKHNARLNDAAMQSAWAMMKPGMTEIEIATHIRQCFKEASMLPLFTIVGTAGNAAFPHHQTGETVLKDGDAVLMDIGGEFNGFPSDMTRMALLGDAPDGYDEVHDLAESAVQAALEAAKPGALAKDVDFAARNVITRAGYGDYFEWVSRCTNRLILRPVQTRCWKKEWCFRSSRVFTCRIDLGSV